MDKSIRMRRLILEILEDGKIHTAKEICDQALKKGIINDNKDSCVRNAVFKLKKENSNFISVDKGKYRLIESSSNENEPKLFDDAYQFLYNEVKDLKKFNWISCSDSELLIARKHIVDLKKLYYEIQKLIV